MKTLKTLTVVAIVALTATSTLAFDLPTSAAVEIVEGITVTQTTGMDFGQVADFDGDLVLATNPATAMTDNDHISYDPTGYTPAVFDVTSIVGATLNATFTDLDGADGLALSAFEVSLDGGSSDEADITAITQASATDTWHVGCTLTVDAATAALGATAVGYNLNVVLN